MVVVVVVMCLWGATLLLTNAVYAHTPLNTAAAAAAAFVTAPAAFAGAGAAVTEHHLYTQS